MQNLDVAFKDMEISAFAPLKLTQMDTALPNAYTLLYCLSGSFMFFTETENYIVLPNQLVLLPPRFASSCHSLPGTPLSVLAFPMEAFCHEQNFFDFFALCQDNLAVMTEKKKIISIYHEMNAFSDMNMPKFSQLSRNVFGMELCTIYVKARIELKKTEHEFTKVLTYMNQNIDKDLSLDELCALLHYNPIYFSKKFKEKMGLSPIKYLSHLRIKKAAQLLCSSSLPIADIAKTFGFANVYYFRTFFSKFVGLSPEDFRLRFSESR